MSARDDICGVLTVEAENIQAAQRYENRDDPDDRHALSIYPINLARFLWCYRTATARRKLTIKYNRTCSSWTCFER